MKKCLRLSILPLFLVSLLFSSCKDEANGGDPNPIISVTVENADVILDQENKRIDILFYEDRSLNNVEATIKLVDGASMYTPLGKNPVTLDLSNTTWGATIVVQTGDELIYYDVFGAIDYPLMSMNITTENGAVVGTATIDQNLKNVRVNFKNVTDLTDVDCEFVLSQNGGQMVSPQTTTCKLDMTKDNTVTCSSTRGGTITYSIKRASSPKDNVPAGWEEVTDRNLPLYMALYTTDDFYGNNAYALLADARASFSVMSKGLDNLMTVPQFYAEDPTAKVIINGSATDDLIVVQGQVVNQGTSGSPTAFGVTQYGTTLIGGTGWNVTYKEAKQNDSVAYYAMYGTNALITDGTKAGSLNDVDNDARSAIGRSNVTSDDQGYYVFFVSEMYNNSPGVTVKRVGDIMYEWGCYDAINLQGGSGSSMHVDGRPTITPKKGLEQHKLIGCVGVLK